jgi:TM2 domain-containing membrane protein YozV
MKGQILEYSVQTNSGAISGSDGCRYYFSGPDWKGSDAPVRGLSVDFEVEGNQAKAIYRTVGSSSPSKNKTAAGLLAIFLGGLGIHKFYLGYTWPGLIYLLCNTVGLLVTWVLLFTPNFVLGVMALVEGIIYLTKTDEEFEQTYVVNKKHWF